MKRKKTAAWPVEKKLEAVRALQRGLTAQEVSVLTGMSKSIVYRCMGRYKKAGASGLARGGAERGSQRSRRAPKTMAAEQAVSQMGPLPEGTGVGKVQGLLYRLGFLKVSRGTVERVLERQRPAPKPRAKRRRNKPPQVRHFERARPNELWQTDIMTFMLRGQYRVYLIGFMDDNSRFLVGWGLHRRQTASNVMEVFRAAIEKRGLPKEVLSDNGRQYYTWRGKSQFTVMLTKLGIAHIRSRPYHPQTCGKIESFWRNLCIFGHQPQLLAADISNQVRGRLVFAQRRPASLHLRSVLVDELLHLLGHLEVPVRGHHVPDPLVRTPVIVVLDVLPNLRLRLLEAR